MRYNCKFINNWGQTVRLRNFVNETVNTREEALQIFEKYKRLANTFGVSWFNMNNEWFQIVDIKK